MSKSKKIVPLICVGILVFACAAALITWLWWANDAYQPTPELAVKKSAEPFNDEHYVIVEHLDTVYFNDYAIVVYISGTGEFTHVSCKYSKSRNKWKIDGYTYINLEKSDKLTDIYYDDGAPRYGYIGNFVCYFKLADDSVAYVNGTKADSKAYTVTQGENIYKIEFWYCETDTTEITVEYRVE